MSEIEKHAASKCIYILLLTYPYETNINCGVYDSFEKALADLEYMKKTKRIESHLYNNNSWEISADHSCHSIISFKTKQAVLILNIEKLELNVLDSIYIE